MEEKTWPYVKKYTFDANESWQFYETGQKFYNRACLQRCQKVGYPTI